MSNEKKTKQVILIASNLIVYEYRRLHNILKNYQGIETKYCQELTEISGDTASSDNRQTQVIFVENSVIVKEFETIKNSSVIDLFIFILYDIEKMAEYAVNNKIMFKYFILDYIPEMKSIHQLLRNEPETSRFKNRLLVFYNREYKDLEPEIFKLLSKPIAANLQSTSTILIDFKNKIDEYERQDQLEQKYKNKKRYFDLRYFDQALRNTSSIDEINEILLDLASFDVTIQSSLCLTEKDELIRAVKREKIVDKLVKFVLQEINQPTIKSLNETMVSLENFASWRNHCKNLFENENFFPLIESLVKCRTDSFRLKSVKLINSMLNDSDREKYLCALLYRSDSSILSDIFQIAVDFFKELFDQEQGTARSLEILHLAEENRLINLLEKIVRPWNCLLVESSFEEILEITLKFADYIKKDMNANRKYLTLLAPMYGLFEKLLSYGPSAQVLLELFLKRDLSISKLINDLNEFLEDLFSNKRDRVSLGLIDSKFMSIYSKLSSCLTQVLLFVYENSEQSLFASGGSVYSLTEIIYKQENKRIELLGGLKLEDNETTLIDKLDHLQLTDQDTLTSRLGGLKIIDESLRAIESFYQSKLKNRALDNRILEDFYSMNGNLEELVRTEQSTNRENLTAKLKESMLIMDHEQRIVRLSKNKRKLLGIKTKEILDTILTDENQSADELKLNVVIVNPQMVKKMPICLNLVGLEFLEDLAVLHVLHRGEKSNQRLNDFATTRTQSVEVFSQREIKLNVSYIHCFRQKSDIDKLEEYKDSKSSSKYVKFHLNHKFVLLKVQDNNRLFVYFREDCLDRIGGKLGEALKIDEKEVSEMLRETKSWKESEQAEESSQHFYLNQVEFRREEDVPSFLGKYSGQDRNERSERPMWRQQASQTAGEGSWRDGGGRSGNFSQYNNRYNSQRRNNNFQRNNGRNYNNYNNG